MDGDTTEEDIDIPANSTYSLARKMDISGVDEVLAVPGQDEKKGTKSQVNDQDYYFNFYSSLQNQANMIGDISRTGTYRKAILGNEHIAFRNKNVLDLGAGSGILSFMSAQAGAKQVIALEASSMADKMAVLVRESNKSQKNPHMKNKIRIVKGMVEDEKVQAEVLRTGKVDTIISEPIGVMLFHERMVESFLLARDLFLKPDGHLLPNAGTLFFCPFTDSGLYAETEAKAQFFNTQLFGTDFSGLYAAAREEVFAQPVVGMFKPSSLISNPCTPTLFDFLSVKKEEIMDFTIPIEFISYQTALCHGLASWFDLDFQPRGGVDKQEDPATAAAWNYPVTGQPAEWPWQSLSNPLNPEATPPAPKGGLQVTLSTGPDAMRTHWQQARLLLPEPLAVNKGERVVGSIHFKANESRSYDITIDLGVDRPGAQVKPNPLLRKGEYNLSQQCFNYSYNPDAPFQ